VGVFADTLSNSMGCDSLLITTISFAAADTTYLTDTSCDPNQVGVFADTLSNSMGCDSIVVLTVSLMGTDTVYLTDTSCDPMDAGIFVDTLSNSMGCDSFVVTTVSLLSSDTIYLQEMTCDPSQVGTDVQTFVNQLGCDSVRIETTSLMAADTTYFYFNTCDPNETGTVTDSYTNQEGCDSMVISVTSLLELDLDVSVIDVLCFEDANGQIFIDTIMGGDGPYLYAIDDQPFQYIPHFVNQKAGNHVVSAQDVNGCEGSMDVYLAAPQQLLVDLGQDTTIELGERFDLDPIYNGNVVSFEWDSHENSLCDSCSIQLITPFYTSSYSLTVVDENGCVARDEIVISVHKNRDVYIPNAFSPNGDGRNDIFKIFATEDVKSVKTFQVFDRWGERVFGLEDFDPNDLEIGWDGTFKSKVLNPGVYIYHAEIEFIDGYIELFKGDVTLMK